MTETESTRVSLWENLISLPNLKHAFLRSRRGKRNRQTVQRFEYYLEYELVRLHRELKNFEYAPGPFRTFLLHDGKPRMISAAPFRDRIVHHAFCQIVEPIFEKSFYFHSYASRCGKGTHAAVRYCQKQMRRFRYVLKCDIRLYFPSIDHEILKQTLKNKLSDSSVLCLADLIIDHSNPQYPVFSYFPGDDLFTPQERRKGLPIGNQTSQFFANVYLDPFDHFVKHQLRANGYTRYADDFVLFSDSKEQLSDFRNQIDEQLKRLRLRLHPNKRVISRTEDGIRFLGYRVFPDRILLTSQAKHRFRRHLNRYQSEKNAAIISWSDLNQRINSCLGHVLQANAYRWTENILYDTVFVGHH